MNKKEKLIKSVDLIEESWHLYIKHVLKFIEVFVYGLMGVIPMFGVLIISVIYTRYLGDRAPVAINVILAIIAFVAFIISVYIAIEYSIRTKVASILLIKNNFTSAKENFKEAKPYFIKFLGVSVLLVVLVMAWGILFLVPALIFAVYYGFAQYVLVVEGKRPFSAMERSYDLVRGYWWPVFGRFVVISVIAILVYIVISWPLNSMTKGDTAAVIYGIFINLVWAVLSPYFLIYSYNLYKNVKEINK